MRYCLTYFGTRFLSSNNWNYSISWWILSEIQKAFLSELLWISILNGYFSPVISPPDIPRPPFINLPKIKPLAKLYKPRAYKGKFTVFNDLVWQIPFWVPRNNLRLQGAKKIIFTACHSDKLKLEFTSPVIISTSPKTFSSSRIDFTLLLLFEFLKEHHLPVGQVKNTFH